MRLFSKPAWFVVDDDGTIVGAYPRRGIADICSYMYDLGFGSRVQYGRLNFWQRYGRRK